MVNGLGDVVSLGRRTAKGVAGYDLAGLMVGSEGTLGVITEITVRLRPARPQERTVAGYFASVVAAGEAVTAVAASGVIPSALELVDRHCLAAVDAWKKTGLSADADVVLLGRVDTPGAEGDAEAEVVRDCFGRAGATWAVVSTDRQEADALFQARRLAYPAWSGSVRCSPRMSACHGPRYRKCWPGSRGPWPGTTFWWPISRMPVTAICTR